MPKDLKALKTWLIDNNCKDVCMESTGKYWIPIFNVLESSCNVSVSHPKYVRAIPSKKTDKKDSIWIADVFKHGLVQPSFMPPLEIRQLRDLMRYRFKLVNLSDAQNSKMAVCLDHYDYINKCIEKLEKAILPLLANYQSQINLLLTVPSVQDISAVYILSKIGANMSVFTSANHLCSWVGLTPQSNESASKKNLLKFLELVYILNLY